jgi:hypothetical protein
MEKNPLHILLLQSFWYAFFSTNIFRAKNMPKIGLIRKKDTTFAQINGDTRQCGCRVRGDPFSR